MTLASGISLFLLNCFAHVKKKNKKTCMYQVLVILHLLRKINARCTGLYAEDVFTVQLIKCTLYCFIFKKF